MSFRLLLQILRARWASFALVLVLVIGAVAATTFLLPKSYTSQASLVVDIKSDPIAGLLNNAASPSYLLTQVDIIQSTRVASRVVSSLRLTEIPQLREQWLSKTKGTGDFAAWLADLLRFSLDVRPSRGSNVINLAYTGPDPAFSTAVTNAFAKAYLDVTLELRTSPAKDYSKFFDANAKGLRDKLEAAQSKLSAYQQANGLIGSDERLDVETARLNDLNVQLVAIQAAAADSQSRQVQAQAQGDRMSDVSNAALVASLRADLARQEGQLQQLTGRLGENHPTVRELKLGIADAKSKVEQEVRRAQSGIGINNTVNQSRVAQAKASLEEQRAKVLRLKALRDEANVLAREAENAQRAYEGVLARLNQTNLESQANQTTVAILEEATVPNNPSAPRIGLNLVLGGLLAFILGIAVVWWRETRDRRVRGASDFEQLLNQPLIGVVPSYKVGGRAGLRLPGAMRPMLGRS